LKFLRGHGLSQPAYDGKVCVVTGRAQPRGWALGDWTGRSAARTDRCGLRTTYRADRLVRGLQFHWLAVDQNRHIHSTPCLRFSVSSCSPFFSVSELGFIFFSFIYKTNPFLYSNFKIGSFFEFFIKLVHFYYKIGSIYIKVDQFYKEFKK
jgi:hypothetical protein